MTSHDAALLDKMTESAGELLFEATAHEDPFARGLLIELAHQLGRLYGETIRACKGYNGLQDEVTATFMTGMAIEPNFGREEDAKSPGQLLYEKKFGNPRQDGPAWSQIAAETHLIWEGNAAKVTRALCLERFPEHAKMQEEKAKEKTPGQLLLEERRKLEPELARWDQLPPSARIAHENKAKRNAAKAEEPNALAEQSERDWRPYVVMVCKKCTGTGNMSQLGQYEKCDVCG